jgi:hypothetical protein
MAWQTQTYIRSPRKQETKSCRKNNNGNHSYLLYIICQASDTHAVFVSRLTVDRLAQITELTQENSVSKVGGQYWQEHLMYLKAILEPKINIHPARPATNKTGSKSADRAHFKNQKQR